MKIYIGNGEIAGYFISLKRGFDKLGVKTGFWPFYGNRFKYKEPKNRIISLFRKFHTKSINLNKAYLPLIVLFTLLSLAIRLFILIYALFKYQTFILSAAHPMFKFIELPVLKFFKKKVIVVFLGSDSRPPYLAGSIIFLNENNYDKGISKCYREVKKRIRRISIIEKYADYIINHPPTSHFHNRMFISWLHIGFPFDACSLPKDRLNNNSGITKILHAPTYSSGKGSAILINTIEKLSDLGLPVELVKLENVPNNKVIEEISRCDLIVDELFSDIPLGGLGTEAAFLKKAVINSGYYSDYIYEDYPIGVIPPAIFCLPDQAEEKI